MIVTIFLQFYKGPKPTGLGTGIGIRFLLNLKPFHLYKYQA
jgi:hypothetical protein